MTANDYRDPSLDPSQNQASVNSAQPMPQGEAFSGAAAPQPAPQQLAPQQPAPQQTIPQQPVSQQPAGQPQMPSYQQPYQHQAYQQNYQYYGHPYGGQQPYGTASAARPAASARSSRTAESAASPAGNRSLWKVFGAGFVGALLACGLCLGVFSMVHDGSDSGKSQSSPASVVLGSQESTEIEKGADEDATLAERVADKALPSVAAIDVYTRESGYGFYDQGDSSLTETSLGSGVVLSEDGYIITNYHVIEGADALKVTVGGEEYDAEVVGTDESSDLAVVKASDASSLTPIELGDSDALEVGEWVMSIGSPFGLEQSVATGIVSATSRSQIYEGIDDYGMSTGKTTIYANMIQTDAAINPGNSGGALVDANGKLIGINTLITSYSGNYSGVGFAIPVNYAITIAQQIIAGETPTHAQLGVSLSTIDSSIASRYGLSVDYGAYISTVYEGSGADEAGLKEGDIVIVADGEKIKSASDLMLAIRGNNPGDTMKLTVNRNGEELEFEATLGSENV